jgi:small-conductance mechanosensitive channel
MPFWQRAIVAGVVIAVTAVAAKVVDLALRRRTLPPQAATRYRVVRRTVMSTIVFVGVLSALLVIPQIRAVAGGILASSAVVAVVIGFAAQRTLGNVIAGILIAFSQPLRLGDTVTIDGDTGIVEDIGLTYTFIRTTTGVRLVIPNDKLASDTIRNSTIRNSETVAEVIVQVPLNQDLDAVVEALRAETTGEVFVSSLEGNASITLRERARSQSEAEALTHDMLLRAHRLLRAAGAYA